MPVESKRFGAVIQEWERLTKVKRMRAERMFFGSSLLIFIFEIGAIYVAIKARGKGTISAGMIILIQIYVFKVIEQLFGIRNILKQLNRAIGESAEMLTILDEPHEIVDYSDKKLAVEAGKVEFINIKFAYANTAPIFTGLDLRIKPGEKIAIVGQS